MLGLPYPRLEGVGMPHCYSNGLYCHHWGGFLICGASLGSPFGLCWCTGGCSFFCCVGLEQSNDCLKVFCPARLPFPGLWPERVGFCWGFLCLCHWYFQLVSFFSSKSGIHEAKGKPKNSLLTVLGLPGPRLVCLLLFQRLLMFVLYKMPRDVKCP